VYRPRGWSGVDGMQCALHQRRGANENRIVQNVQYTHNSQNI
jgi:hypothetical protein